MQALNKWLLDFYPHHYNQRTAWPMMTQFCRINKYGQGMGNQVQDMALTLHKSLSHSRLQLLILQKERNCTPYKLPSKTTSHASHSSASGFWWSSYTNYPRIGMSEPGSSGPHGERLWPSSRDWRFSGLNLSCPSRLPAQLLSDLNDPHSQWVILWAVITNWCL